MARVYLLRHGESQANVGGFINDDPQRPVHLTERGRRQAAEAAIALAGVAFTQAWVSRFPRAQQTAEIVLAGLNLSLPLQVDARLDERRSGLDGQPVEAFNGLVRLDPVNIRPAAGESFLEQMQRVKGFLDGLNHLDEEAAVLAVSHENPIMAATALVGRPVEEAARGSLDNCGWVVVDWPGSH